MKYEFLEHTGDAKFKAYGNNLEECFTNAAEAMSSLMVDPEKVQGKMTKSISITGSDLKALLYNFLEEIIVLIDTDSFVLHKVQSIKINPASGKYLLNAVLSGDNSENYKFETGVKAVTYNEMEVTENYVQVVVDI